MQEPIFKKRSKSAQRTIWLGAHFSIAKGIHNALLEAAAYGCNALQLFTKNANTWKERTLSADEIEKFEAVRAETGIHYIASHTSYLINLASPDKEIRTMSREALRQELIRSSQLHIPYVVLHPGSHVGSGERKGIFRIAESVNRIYSAASGISVRLLFETTAGQGASIGHGFEQLALLLDKVENKPGIGICLDSGHIFAAGYDLRTPKAYLETMAAFDSVIGRSQLYLIHLNDSKKDLGSNVDRHEHIGRGKIGLPAFGFIMNDPGMVAIPKIIETPKEERGMDWDAVNLKCLRELVKGEKV